MIPRKLHTVRVGDWKPTELEERCTGSLHRVLTDYAFYRWNDQSGPGINKPYFKAALKSKPVNASNYLRLLALYEFGGVYVDNDVEMLRPFYLSPDCFISFQRSDLRQDCINTAVVGAIQGHPFVGALIRAIELSDPAAFPVWPACTLPTEMLYQMGMKGLNIEQVVGSVTVYDKERFFPFFHDETPNRGTDRTYAIHHWGKSWG